MGTVGQRAYVANCPGATERSKRVTNRTGSTARKHVGSRLYLCGVCDEPRLIAIQAEIEERQGEILRAPTDYDTWIIEGFDLKRVCDEQKLAIAGLEIERLRLSIGSELDVVLGARKAVKAFDGVDLAVKRRIIDFFCTVSAPSACCPSRRGAGALIRPRSR